MLRLGEFDLLMPESLDEAVAAMRERPDAVLIAGGTDIIPKLKRRQARPSLLVSTSRIPGMSGVTAQDGSLRIGASTTLRALERCEDLGGFGALRDAVREVATPVIRNTATVGGNLFQDTRCRFYDRSLFWRDAIGYCLKHDGHQCQAAPGGSRCYAAFCSDLAPALIVLDAVCTLRGERERTVAVEDLYRDDGAANTGVHGEILTAVTLEPAGLRSVYRKLRVRESFDFPEVGLAVAVRESENTIQVSIAVSGVASDVVVLREEVSRAGVPGLADRVYRAVKPVDTMGTPPAYRKAVARNMTRRCLDELLPAR